MVGGWFEFCDRDRTDKHRSVVGCDQAEHRRDGRRLTRTVRTGEQRELSGFHSGGQTVGRPAITPVDADVEKSDRFSRNGARARSARRRRCRDIAGIDQLQYLVRRGDPVGRVVELRTHLA
ncbi:Uncharacterised protein [Mycobacteroides abscessus subsp. abscessus]|nr:Uncharacterised protein [Mycobacteroides abscessus subsp. abscessus]